MCEQQVDQVAQDCGFPDRGPGLYQLPGRRSRRNSQTVKFNVTASLSLSITYLTPSVSLFPDLGPGLYQLLGRRSRRNSQTVKI